MPTEDHVRVRGRRLLPAAVVALPLAAVAAWDSALAGWPVVLAGALAAAAGAGWHALNSAATRKT
ncbi:hypothetical protein [Streptomyces sp. NBC_00091]|uniref:hypothetical protein n=1 Tax=Streptomyces sp. NBC_00091 TaxID=2975648 RepID=UPI00224CAF62|nr:hypothetical protein [Streptomyces sp. NBC_00091]MCX5380067.1 hypothetical protein [Streptomyces sp. NBC_00091]